MAWGRGSTRAWRALRATILRRDPTCRLRLEGCTLVSTEVDHRVNVEAGGTDDPANLRGVCAPCHERKTLAEASIARHRRRPPEPHPNQAGGPTPHPHPAGHRNV